MLPVLLIAGNNAIDQPEPDRSTGLMFYGGAIFRFLAGLAIAWSLPGAPRLAEMRWILTGSLFGAFLAMVMEYPPYTFIELAMPLGIGAAAWFAFFVAAMYHARTIDRQLEMPRKRTGTRPDVDLA